MEDFSCNLRFGLLLTLAGTMVNIGCSSSNDDQSKIPSIKIGIEKLNDMNDFRGIEFGISIENEAFKDAKPVTPDSNNTLLRPTEEMSYQGVPLDKVWWVFSEGTLWEVLLRTSGEKHSRKLLLALRNLFGPGEKSKLETPSTMTQKIIWKGELLSLWYQKFEHSEGTFTMAIFRREDLRK